MWVKTECAITADRTRGLHLGVVLTRSVAWGLNPAITRHGAEMELRRYRRKVRLTPVDHPSVKVNTDVGLGLLALLDQLPCEPTAPTSEVEYIAARVAVVKNRLAGRIIEKRLLSGSDEGTHLGGRYG